MKSKVQYLPLRSSGVEVQISIKWKNSSTRNSNVYEYYSSSLGRFNGRAQSSHWTWTQHRVILMWWLLIGSLAGSEKAVHSQWNKQQIFAACSAVFSDINVLMTAGLNGLQRGCFHCVFSGTSDMFHRAGSSGTGGGRRRLVRLRTRVNTTGHTWELIIKYYVLMLFVLTIKSTVSLVTSLVLTLSAPIELHTKVHLKFCHLNASRQIENGP